MQTDTKSTTRPLGQTNAQVFPIGLGGMPLSLDERPSEKDAIRVIHEAIDLGVNLIDTANVYCIDDNDIGHNEALIAKALKEKLNSKNVFVATKGGLKRPKGAWVTDASPQELRKACEKSLKDLDVECIFLYQLHAPDDRIPLEESVEALIELKKEGKIQHIGLSNVNQEDLSRVLPMTRIESVQNRCHVQSKMDIKSGLVQFCLQNKISYIAYSPVGGHYGHSKLSQLPVLGKIALNHKASTHEIALAWLLAKSPNILPIPGASKLKSIQSSVRAAQIILSQQEVGLLDEI